ncbi:threonine-phosphate decarboxylase [Lutibacter sp. B2]|nr:threonine-phosphate decarboxylase [Lutibacter sp. B2]
MKIAKHGGNIYEMEKKVGIDKSEFIDFSANINPIGVPESFKNALIENIDIIKNYPDPDYDLLIESISNYHTIDKSFITVGNGATEVIFSMINSIKPKCSLILAPTFLEYERALIKAGSRVKYFELEENNAFCLDNNFLNVIENDIDCIILCNPNNPTSQLVSSDLMKDILAYCNTKNIHLIVDEAFIDFVDNPDAESLLKYTGQYNNLYIIKALTKFFALPGLRIGYGITSNQSILQDIKSEKEPWTVNSYAALAGEVVLKDKNYIKQSREWIVNERKRFYNLLKEIDSIKVYKPNSNYILFKVKNKEIKLKEILLKNKILIRSCDNYRNLTNDFYRIAIKDKESNDQLIKILQEVYYGS